MIHHRFDLYYFKTTKASQSLTLLSRTSVLHTRSPSTPGLPLRCQEDDRQFLVKQIVALKQDNKRLTAEVTSMANDLQEVSLYIYPYEGGGGRRSESKA